MCTLRQPELTRWGQAAPSTTPQSDEMSLLMAAEDEIMRKASDEQQNHIEWTEIEP